MIRCMLALLLCCFAILSAQDLSKLQLIGKPEKSPSEIVAVRDANGRFCAAVQVISDMDGFSYDSYNGVVKVDDQPGQDMVYLQPDERVLEIFKNGYKPLKLILSEIGIQLKPKEVWKIEIKGEAKERGEQIEKGVPTSLTITSQPSGAKIYLNDEYVGETPFEQEVPSNIYDLRLSKDKHQDYLDKIVLMPNVGKKLNLELTPRLGTLQITAPGDAQVFLDNKNVGRGSSTHTLLIGKYSVEASKEKHVNDSRVVTVLEGQTETVRLAPKPRYGTLRVNITPSDARGADVYINGKIMGKAPLTIDDLFEGEYTIDLKKQRFLEKRIPVTITYQKTSNITAHLITYSGSVQAKRDNWKRKRNWTMIGTALFAGAGVSLKIMAGQKYSDYQSATSSDIAVSARNSTENFDRYSMGAFIGAGVFGAWTLYYQIRKSSLKVPDPDWGLNYDLGDQRFVLTVKF